MKNKKSKYPFFSASLTVIGFFLVLGTVGALECDNIGIGQAIIQALIGSGITYLGFHRLEKGGF